jgi:hypothetical protein
LEWVALFVAILGGIIITLGDDLIIPLFRKKDKSKSKATSELEYELYS